MNNLVVQLLLKTGSFSTDLKQAGGQVQQFKKNCQTAGQSVSAFSNALGINVGALTKFGGAVGAAVLAGKELKAIIDSTQTSADAFQGVIAGCTGVLETFNASIARADFSAFANGLWSVYDAAKAARDAIDALQDAQWGYGMLSSDNQANFANAQNNYREAKSALKTAKTKEEREKAQADMEKYRKQMEDLVEKEEEAARNFQYKNMNAIKTTIRSRNPNINEKDITEAQIMEVASIFNSVNSDAEKKKWKDRANQVKRDAKKYKDSAARQAYLNDYDRQTALIIDELLELPNKKIEAVAQELQAGKNARRSAESMRRTFIRATGSETEPTRTTGSTTKVKKDEREIMKGSLTYWQNIKAEETAARDALVKDTEQWKIHNANVEEAEAKIKELTEKIEEIPEASVFSSKWFDEEIKKAKDKLSTLTIGTPDWKDWKTYMEALETYRSIMETDTRIDELVAIEPPTLASLKEMLSIMIALREVLPTTSKEFKDATDNIEKLKKKINDLEGVPEFKAPETNQWEKFNQAMANTSTIVSSVSNTFKEGAEMTAASVLQMVATCLPAIGNLISALDALTVTEAVEAGTAAVGKAVSTSQHWVEAIAAVASLSAVVAAAIAAASRPKTQKFATGGIVGGNSFYGDRVSAQVNSGEMILNRSQQARLFQMANSGGMGGQVEFHISGTELVGVLNNQNRKNNLIR